VSKAFSGEEIDQTMSIARRTAPTEQSRALAMSGFQKSASDVGGLQVEAGGVAAVAREEAEIKAALVLAMQNPRDEQRAYGRILNSCKRPTFAQTGQYAFPRGGKTVKGPSVDMAREFARVWGNMRYGIRIVSDDGKMVHIKGYALDLEANNYSEHEDKFAKLIQRKVKNETTGQAGGGGTAWVVPDERDLRELVMRRGAILVRNSILTLMPPDVVDDACAACDETLRLAEQGEIEQDREGASRKMAMAFLDIGVSTDMLKAYMGHGFDVVTSEEMAHLRQIYKSIIDGQSTRDDYFAVAKPSETGPKAAPAASKADSMLNELKQDRSEATAEAPTPNSPLSPSPGNAGGKEALFPEGSKARKR